MKKQQVGVGGAVAMGVGVCMVIMLIGITISAALIVSNRISVASQEYCIMIIALISSFLGAATALKGAEGIKLILSSLIAMVYFLILLAITAVLFEGQYQGIGVTALLILCGTTVGSFLGTKDKKRVISRKSKMKHRQFIQKLQGR